MRLFSIVKMSALSTSGFGDDETLNDDWMKTLDHFSQDGPLCVLVAGGVVTNDGSLDSLGVEGPIAVFDVEQI